MTKKKLLFSVTKNDFEIQTFRSGGPGGQHQNKRDSGVRIIHKVSGARGEARDRRSQTQNKRAAFERLVNSLEFQVWLKKEAGRAALTEGEKELLQQQIERKVDKWMDFEYLKIEMLDENGNWVEISDIPGVISVSQE